ncbi:HK97 family phage prohead protease [[Clostridium] innocuum]|uniref:HK97 family phage prohead protease n=1 Tax=Clostridium innocuum TaxID=1522 RepID=UPI001AF5675C|nr:HK97 family phage prohead protease [[Clostridium] innocuum]QSI27778.1 caudovirus prohead protease [Erysipelotrichaceae bacterium 66202529]DAU14196.1 MAG TPA: major capsid protein [Caudoviricetes sp.]MCC2832116.1 HK97 family phage prohead protease [[Clostridium] innocuum]MCR0247042.1 HK97 family phage prohead protease [[Clostridium] innocuum]MCR0258404.1 HK97 family phage prohead protease [[Clostridium] innocuum]
MKNYDFGGWATKNDLLCSDGRIIKRDAFKHYDGKKVPLVWNHQHNDASNIVGHALLENRKEGVYTYGSFNDTEDGERAKKQVKHGDIDALSIYANHLKQNRNEVIHGEIREVSLVIAGANPGASIDTILMHGDGTTDELNVDEGILYTGEFIDLGLQHTDTDKSVEEKTDKEEAEKEETIEDILNTMNEKQQKVLFALVGQLVSDDEDADDEEPEELEHSDTENNGGNIEMKHNVFDVGTKPTTDGVLCHADQTAIIELAKSSNVGRLSDAIRLYSEEHDHLAHGIDDIETLFPEYKDVRPGAPELINNDLGWVTTVMDKVHKSPITRIRTRHADARGAELRAKGYKKGAQKTLSGNIKLLKRTTDPQTVYRKDEIHRDDIIDITDFDVVEYQYGVMKNDLHEELATAIMIGDGREDGDNDKISEDHIRSIWNDDELYTIHKDVDIDAARKELQGTNTAANFGDNYVYAEAIIASALYSREKYKGSGTPDFYCTPHLLNVMLLARDMNGRRIYDSKTDLAAALNVGDIHTVEQFEGKIRTDKDDKQHKLLGIFVNLDDYYVGATKGGEITRFEQFDIDFNKEKYLIETRVSGALTKVYSAIALEEPVTSAPTA